MALHSIQQQIVKCSCGKVQMDIHSTNALRLVCYCKDCRGYCNTVHRQTSVRSTDANTNPRNNANHHDGSINPWLDPWGGCDYTHMFPSDLKVIQGMEQIAVIKIRDTSKVHRFYATCCNTPLFSIGPSKTVLLNSKLINDKDVGEVRFRIIGRDALVNTDTTEKRPSMSWSVPLSWFWTMPGRMNKEKTPTFPVEIPETVRVIENFKQG